MRGGGAGTATCTHCLAAPWPRPGTRRCEDDPLRLEYPTRPCAMAEDHLCNNFPSAFRAGTGLAGTAAAAALLLPLASSSAVHASSTYRRATLHPPRRAKPAVPQGLPRSACHRRTFHVSRPVFLCTPTSSLSLSSWSPPARSHCSVCPQMSREQWASSAPARLACCSRCRNLRGSSRIVTDVTSSRRASSQA